MKSSSGRNVHVIKMLAVLGFRERDTRPGPWGGSARAREQQCLGEIPKRFAVGVVLAGIEDSRRSSMSHASSAVAAPARDRQVPDVVLQLAFTEDVIPKSDLLDQFTLAVAQASDAATDSCLRRPMASTWSAIRSWSSLPRAGRSPACGAGCCPVPNS